MRLSGTGQLLLVHTITDGGDVFFPCTYGYACAVRKTQGASLDMGCLYFDHCYPPDRGYGYVAASRFKSREHLCRYGSLRRTDWLAVGRGDDPSEQTIRGPESEDEDEDFEPKPWELESGSDADGSSDFSSTGSVEENSVPVDGLPGASGGFSECDAYKEFGLASLE